MTSPRLWPAAAVAAALHGLEGFPVEVTPVPRCTARAFLLQPCIFTLVVSTMMVVTCKYYLSFPLSVSLLPWPKALLCDFMALVV